MSTGTRAHSRAEAACALALALLTAGAGAQAAELVGAARVIAGDRLAVGGVELVLDGIDAPEPGQHCSLRGRRYDCGHIAATALMDLTAGVEITCRTLDAARPARARCRLPDGYDLSEGMVYTGWALAWPREGNPLLEQERIAKARRHGLWRGRFIEPWRWRAGERAGSEPDQ